ncbi:unnamed protein product [Nesidiocoris tenuis]|uniref:C2H2-type domain-containing protein n=1 Tax=Nesidiocoris tenuis TaxID=355587 RepID=A0A6H5H8U0_9HEMI|nr:unnamed protein product [Nesidiocoris tenuis]
MQNAEGLQPFGTNTIIGGPLDDSPGTFTLLEPTDSPQTVTLLDPNGNADSPQTTIIDIADPSALAENKRAKLNAVEKTSDKTTADEEDEERMANVFFSCGSCLKVCTSMGELRKHMHELCDYKIALRDRYMIHEKRHRQHKEFSCQYCSKRFSQKTQLRNHEVLHLKKACSSALPGWAKRKECELCGKSFWDSKALKKHIKTVHSKLKPYVCQVCGHCSARKGMFQLHIRQHTGDKPHACSVCDFATRDHNTLRRHMMRHTGVRQYQCKFCSYSAIQAFMFKSHLIKHHDGEGVFRCTKCPYSTLNEQAFHYHKHDDGSGELIAVSLPEDDESINYFDHTIDTGGITIAEDIKSGNPQEEIGCLEGGREGGSKIEESQADSGTTAYGASGNTLPAGHPGVFFLDSPFIQFTDSTLSKFLSRFCQLPPNPIAYPYRPSLNPMSFPMSSQHINKQRSEAPRKLSPTGPNSAATLLAHRPRLLNRFSSKYGHQ